MANIAVIKGDGEGSSSDGPKSLQEIDELIGRYLRVRVSLSFCNALCLYCMCLTGSAYSARI